MSDFPIDEPEDRPSTKASEAQFLVNQPGVGRGNFSAPQQKAVAPLRMVETAFFASASSLIYFINYYLPLGPVLQLFFPVPIALVYLRWGNRAARMAALVSGLLLAVLMGPSRSILFVIPYCLMGILLGWTWRRQSPWAISIGLGTLLGVFGFFFRFWLLSLLSGEDIWGYTINQVTSSLEWTFDKLGLLNQPSVVLIQGIAIAMVFVNNFIYLFAVHLAAWLLLDRIGNPIPRPPNWVQVLLDYEA